MAAYDCRNLHILDLVDAKLTIYLQPGLCTQVPEGVSEVLDSSLFRYLDDHEAVLLAYRNVKILSKQALLTPYLPYLTIEAQADLFFLRPVPGEILVGLVHKLSGGMLGLVALGGINATINAKDMPDGLSFDAKHNCWVPHGDYSRAMMIGDIVACKVLSAPETDPFEKELVFSLDASLQHPHAGLCAQQPQLQDQKRKQLAAMAAAAKPQTERLNGVPEASTQAGGSEQKEKQRHQKHKHHKKDKDRSSDKTSKKRKRGRDDALPDAQAKKHRRRSDDSGQKAPQQQKPEGLSNGMPAASAPGPTIPAEASSRKHKKHRHVDSSPKHHSSHKKSKHKRKHKKDKHKSQHKTVKVAERQ